MLPEEMTPDDLPVLWIDHAKAELILAQSKLLPGGMYVHLCFHAQQAAEKAIKAVLLHCKIEYPLTHNLGVLIDLLPPTYPSVDNLDEAVDLNAYAVEKRYPGQLIFVDKQEWERAIILSKRVVEFADAAIPRP